jgi:uncharacterized RDD family membrane protein YckC
VVERRDIGSWLDGPAAYHRTHTGQYAGQRLGLPAVGPGSIGRFGRRLIAVFIDWGLCLLIAAGLFHVPLTGAGSGGFVPLAVFAAENVLLVGTVGSTVGHRALGLRVLSLDGTRAGLAQVLSRTLLLVLAVPALIWDRDGRGLHDRVPNTVLVTTR